MRIDFDSQTPIYTQLAEGLEDAILADTYAEEQQIPSTTELSLAYGINPATALKGVNQLVNAGIVYKKRGLGMFVSGGAKEAIIHTRKQAFMTEYIVALLLEAKKLGIGREELVAMIKEAK